MSTASISTQTDEAVNLHEIYQRNSACGFNRALHLRTDDVQSLSSRLRGIRAISALFIATANSEAVDMSEWMRSGLVEAVHVLAGDAHVILELENERVEEARA